MEEDARLMKSFKDGDKESFEALVIKYRESAIAFCQSFVHDYYAAEDIVQECFAIIYVYKERYKEKYAFKTYLFTIIRNKSIDYIRRNHSIPLDEIVEPISKDDTEDITLRKERRALVREKVNELKSDYKTAIYLIDFQELSYKDAAQIMGKNLMQIKILVYRARKKLRVLIEEEV